jgi:hypothetical protein
MINKIRKDFNIHRRRNTYPQLVDIKKMSVCSHCFSIIDEIETIHQRYKILEDKIKILEQRINDLEPSIQTLTPKFPTPNLSDDTLADFYLAQTNFYKIESYDNIELN